MRTLESSFAVVFGSRSEAEATIRRVNAIHGAVRGQRPMGRPYSALDPEALLWVHATLVDTALRVYDRFVAPLALPTRRRYHEESGAGGDPLGVPDAMLPPTIDELRALDGRSMVGSGRIRVTPDARRIARTVLYPIRVPAAAGMGRGAPRLARHPAGRRATRSTGSAGRPAVNAESADRRRASRRAAAARCRR